MTDNKLLRQFTKDFHLLKNHSSFEVSKYHGRHHGNRKLRFNYSGNLKILGTLTPFQANLLLPNSLKCYLNLY